MAIFLLRARRTSNMLRENANNSAPNNGVAIELVRRDALDYFTQAHKLRLALGRQRAPLASEIVHCDTTYLTFDRLALVQHRKFERHPINVVTQNPAPHERHLGACPDRSATGYFGEGYLAQPA